MGFLKQFFRTVFREGTLPESARCFEKVTIKKMEEHFAISHYGKFQLTQAIRPSFEHRVLPEEGFRMSEYHDVRQGYSVPVLLGAISGEKIFNVFIDLLDTLGDVVDIVLESSHNSQRGGHTDYMREMIDISVLKSILFDFEDLLTHDGCTGVAILSPSLPREVKFDEHKLLVVYGENTTYSRKIFESHRIRQMDSLRLLTDAEHLHSTRQSFKNQFERLKRRLSAEKI